MVDMIWNEIVKGVSPMNSLGWKDNLSRKLTMSF